MGIFSNSRILAVAVAALIFVPMYGFAQVDMSGEWQQKQHEDQPERGAGPEIGDYTGPCKGGCLGRGKVDAAGTRM